MKNKAPFVNLSNVYFRAEDFKKAAYRTSGNLGEQDSILLFPTLMCISFSCELYLKYILLLEMQEPKIKDLKDLGHNIDDLFKKISLEIKTEILSHMDSTVAFDENISTMSNKFIESRYEYEYEKISISAGFDFEFMNALHITCKRLFDSKDDVIFN